jgi:hypothetical protein
MKFLERTIQDAIGTLEEARKSSYARAMQKSLTIDHDFDGSEARVPKIYGPEDIAQDGLDTKMQYDLRVSVLKPVALEFLREIPGFTERGFAKKSTWKYFDQRFNQTPFFIHHNPRIMMLTYAQWLHLVMDNPPNPELPNELKAYFEQ